MVGLYRNSVLNQAPVGFGKPESGTALASGLPTLHCTRLHCADRQQSLIETKARLVSFMRICTTTYFAYFAKSRISHIFFAYFSKNDGQHNFYYYLYIKLIFHLPFLIYSFPILYNGAVLVPPPKKNFTLALGDPAPDLIPCYLGPPQSTTQTPSHGCVQQTDRQTTLHRQQ